MGNRDCVLKQELEAPIIVPHAQQKAEMKVEINNKKIKTSPELQEVVARHRPGDEMKITVNRERHRSVERPRRRHPIQSVNMVLSVCLVFPNVARDMLYIRRSCFMPKLC